MLVATGVGALLSPRVLRTNRHVTLAAVAAAALLAALPYAALRPLARATLEGAPALRFGGAAACAAVVGLVLGLFFPAGLRALPRREGAALASGSTAPPACSGRSSPPPSRGVVRHPGDLRRRGRALPGRRLGLPFALARRVGSRPCENNSRASPWCSRSAPPSPPARSAWAPYNVALVAVGLLLVFADVLPHAELSSDLVLVAFLPLLVFEGALFADADSLREASRPILALALPGVAISLVATAAVATFVLGLPFSAALLLGALLAITDTVSVLLAFRSTRVPKRLAAVMEGESLFNDGTALVLVSITSAALATGHFGVAATARSCCCSPSSAASPWAPPSAWWEAPCSAARPTTSPACSARWCSSSPPR